jgi:hypothetical protein
MRVERQVKPLGQEFEYPDCLIGISAKQTKPLDLKLQRSTIQTQERVYMMFSDHS